MDSYAGRYVKLHDTGNVLGMSTFVLNKDETKNLFNFLEMVSSCKNDSRISPEMLSVFEEFKNYTGINAYTLDYIQAVINKVDNKLFKFFHANGLERIPVDMSIFLKDFDKYNKSQLDSVLDIVRNEITMDHYKVACKFGKDILKWIASGKPKSWIPTRDIDKP